MRRRLLLSAATILCCGYSSLAYSQHTLTGSPTIAPQLFLAQSSGPEQFDAPDESASAKLSPFDLFGPEEKQEKAQDQLLSQPEQPVAEGSIPVGHNNRPSATANAIGGQIQPAYFPPIDYASHQRRTPNLIANFMTQEWCADGLWSNYESERIAQCAKQAQRIAGRHHHCGQCGPSGCVQQPAPACAAQHRHFGSGRHFQRGGMNALNQGCSQCDSAPQSERNCGCAQLNPSTAEVQPQFVNSRVPQDLPPPPQNDGSDTPTTVNGRVASHTFNPLNIPR